MTKSILTASCLAFLSIGHAQQPDVLQEQQNLEAVHVSFSQEEYEGRRSIRVVPAAAETEAKFVKVTNVDFVNGTIELKMAGRRLAEAGQGARGFVGLAFRVKEDHSQFECFYLRPTNGRAEDQLRRNHSVQYISFPDYPWYKLRKETPGLYETYADLEEGAWTDVKIVVEDEKARLYVHGVDQPTLLVNDLKLGDTAQGSIGLWVGPGTEAFFADLKVTSK